MVNARIRQSEAETIADLVLYWRQIYMVLSHHRTFCGKVPSDVVESTPTTYSMQRKNVSISRTLIWDRLRSQLYGQNLHNSKAVPTAKLPSFKGSSYGETLTVQMQFLQQNIHYSKAILTVKLPLFKGSSNRWNFHYSKAVLMAKLPLFKGSCNGETSTTIQRRQMVPELQ